ncbi:MAG: hypothetical protein IT373_31435 [Polyangiaceae bacterium]|nr:hypothetical protein [Polyangiaceae bacterium]
MRFIFRSFALATLLAAVAAGGLAACGPTEQHVKDELAAANYCAAASECVNVGSQCPFGCYLLVNVAEADAMRELLEDYRNAPSSSECMYDCVAMTTIECVAGKCQMAP